MAATGVYYDCVDLKVTYGATTVELKEATKVNLRMKDKQALWQRGGSRFATVSVIESSDRGIDIEGGDCVKLNAVPRGVLCTVTGKIPDPENGLGEGCLLFTVARAKIDDSSIGGQARQFAMAGASFTCTSADGNTDPIQITEQGAGGGGGS